MLPSMAQQRLKGLDQSVYNFTDGLHQQNMLNSVQNFYRTDVCTDIKLCSNDNINISCHKVILCAASPYFHAMFTSGLEECRSDNVVLNSIDGTCLQLVIDFMYTSKIKITTENVQNLVIAACLFQLERLQKECEEFIIYHLDPENCVGSYMLADIYHLVRVKEKALFMMLQKFSSIVNNETFLDLTLNQLVMYLGMDKLCIRAEAEVFEGVVKWLEHNSGTPDHQDHNTPSGGTEEHYAAALEPVRFQCMSSEYIRSTCLNHRYTQTSSIQDKIDQILAKTRSAKSGDADSVAAVDNRCGDFSRLVMYDENDFVFYNPLKDMWDLFCACPEEVVTTTAFVDAAVFGHRVCAVEGGLLLTGGWDGDTSYRHCWFYDLINKKWMKKADILEARCTHAMVYVLGTAYVIGGLKSDSTTSDSIECYNATENRWTMAKENIPALCYVESAVVGSIVYVVGDEVGRGRLHQYQVSDHTWTTVGEVPFEQSQSLIHHGERLYSFDTDKYYYYSIPTGTWARITYNKIGDIISAPVMWNGDVVCVTSHWDLTRSWDTLGENDKPKVVKSVVNKFDFESRKWSELYIVQEYQPSGHQGAALPMLAVDFSNW